MTESTAKRRRLTDDEAWIVSHNLYLVDACLRRRNCDDATWQDLRAAGYLGLCRAIKLYDHKIAMWSTYACVWIRSFIQKELRVQADLIRIPGYQQYDHKSERTCNLKRHRPDYVLAAQRVMKGRRVPWEEGEAAAVLAVMPPQEHESEAEINLEACIARLPVPYRQIIQRVMLDGEQPRDVAADLGLAVGAIGSYQHYGLKRLKVMIIEKAVTMIDATKQLSTTRK